MNRAHPLIKVNKSAKFDEEAHSSLVSIVFTTSKRDGHMHWRTEPQQHYNIPSATRCAGITEHYRDGNHHKGPAIAILCPGY